MLKVIGSHAERLAAVGAHVRLLAGVQRRVYLRADWAMRALIENKVGAGSLPGTDRSSKTAYLKISGRFERFMAHLARELSLTVHVLPVTAHAARAPEPFAAIDADVREFARVFAYVDLQAVLVNEPVSAVNHLIIAIAYITGKLTQHYNADTDAV